MYSNKKVLLVLCVTLNFVNLNSGTNKKSFSSSYGPNFDPEYPHFTPFNNEEFIDIEDDLTVADDDDDGSAAVAISDMITGDSNNYPPFVAVPAPVPTQQTPQQNHFENMNPAKDEQFQERIKPLKNFVMGLYQNYRSTYMGNQTIGSSAGISTLEDGENRLEESVKPKKVRRKIKSKKKHLNGPVGEELKYNVGPGVNVSLNADKELVNVYLDEDCLKDVFTARGKKQDLISKILPLFILPFLIQSAIVPFVVTTLKLLLIKSIIVGKIAIFLLIISAFRHNTKYGGGYDAPPAYIVDPPSRRSEAAVGYRVEGKPTTWVN